MFTIIVVISRYSEWSTVVDISIPPPSFKPVSLSLSRISSILKHPNMSFFNPYKYIFDIFYHTVFTVFYNYTFFRFNVKNNFYRENRKENYIPKRPEQLICPKTPEDVVDAKHVGGFGLFCYCCAQVWDQKNNQNKTEDQKKQDELERKKSKYSKRKRASIA